MKVLSSISRAELLERLAQLDPAGFSSLRAGSTRTLAWGHDELQAALPEWGWPLGAITELLTDTAGIGELRLMLPALRSLARDGRQIVWVAPPYLPYAPTLIQHGLPPERVLLIHAGSPQQSLWAIEQTLRCPAIGAVLGWVTHSVDRQLRRLQLAAQAGSTLGILHRPSAAVLEPSPAALRLHLRAAADELLVEVKKCRGGRAGARLRLRDIHARA